MKGPDEISSQRGCLSLVVHGTREGSQRLERWPLTWGGDAKGRGWGRGRGSRARMGAQQGRGRLFLMWLPACDERDRERENLEPARRDLNLGSSLLRSGVGVLRDGLCHS